MAEVLLLYDDAMVEHDPGGMHPERPDRLRAIRRHLDEHPLTSTRWAKPTPAPRAAIERIHPAAHIDTVDALRGQHGHLDGDTAVSPGSVPAAYLATGAAIDGVAAVVGGHSDRAFALVRPPGHHAEANHAMGFCLFNSVAIAAAHARAELGCERVLIVDWDVHHGNGTQHSFYDDPNVLFVSSHQFPFYPGTGSLREQGQGPGEGFTVNLPLPPGLQDGEVTRLYAELLPPIAEAFDPDLVLVSAGFDAHRDDPLAGMELSEDGFASVCATVREVADRHADGRLVLLLEGGYDLDALAKSVHGCIEILGGATPPEPAAPGPRERVGLELLRLATEHHGRHWKL